MDKVYALRWVDAITVEIAVVVIIGLSASYYIYRQRQQEVSIKSFLSARKTFNWPILTVSLLATYIGNWTLFTPADFGSLTGVVGVISYGISAIVPVILLGIIGPHISNTMSEIGFTSTDFFKARYGRITHIILSIFALLYMWVALIAELTTIAMSFGMIVNYAIPTFWSILPVSIGTLAYTTYSGLPVSIFTDRFQTILVIITGCVIFIAAMIVNPLDPEFLTSIKLAPEGSWISGIALIITVYPSEILNQSAWQRILSCKTDKDIRWTCFFTSLILFFIICFFGFLGLMSDYLYPSCCPSGGTVFALVRPLKQWILVIILIFSIALVTSTIDSAQNAMTALLGSFFIEKHYSLLWARVMTIIFNIPAIVVASFGLNIFNLFYTANLLCLSVVAPQFLAFHHYCTESGALAGFFIGFISIPIVGWIETRDFVGGITFFYPSDLANISYIIIGVVTPILSAIGALLVSFIEKKYSRNNSRAHLFDLQAQKEITPNL